jgi:glycosyltransferase involved in cell wall biosynthesis
VAPLADVHRPPRLSVVVPCRNARATLPRVLASLDAQDVPPEEFEVVVVDDGSTDDSAAIAAGHTGPARVRLVAQPHRGLAAARNAGAAAARGPVLLFLDADVLAAPDVVRRHVAHHTADRALLAVQGRTVPDAATLATPFGRTSHRGADRGGAPTAWPARGARGYGPPPGLHRGRPARGRCRGLSPVRVVGRHLSITRAGHEAVGGFDERFTGYGFEDVDYALRFRRAGGRIVDDPGLVGVHCHPLTIEAAAARQRENGRAAVYLWRKHGCPAWLALHLELHPVLLPLKWLVFRTRPVAALVGRVRPWAERTERLLVLNECYNHLLWRGYYEGVFEALRAGASTSAPAAGARPGGEDR